jgi:hypothetical protein
MILKLIIILENNKDSDLQQNLHFCSKKKSKNLELATVREAGKILMTHKIRLILLLSFHKKVRLKTICFT